MGKEEEVGLQPSLWLGKKWEKVDRRRNIKNVAPEEGDWVVKDLWSGETLTQVSG